MVTLIYKKSGNRVSLHVENRNIVQIRFSKSLGEIRGLNPDLSDKLIGYYNQVFTYRRFSMFSAIVFYLPLNKF